MSNFRSPDHAAREGARARRVLVCAAGGGGAAFAARLAAAGYEVQSVGAGAGVREIENFAPQVVVVEARGTAHAGPARRTSDAPRAQDAQTGRRTARDRPATRSDDEPLALARRLRADYATARLPLVVIFGDARRAREEAEESVRASALEVGADDCFSLSTPAPEVLARLDALFWRVEAGRSLSAARAAVARRAEIDGFMQLLDAARTSIGANSSGALALIAAVADDEGTDEGAHERALRTTHEFFQSNLRRADAIAFYGPRLLLARLARPRSGAAREAVARLHAEFLSVHPRARICVGVAQFPEDGTEIEGLIERAEASLEAALAQDARLAAERKSKAAREVATRPGGAQKDDRHELRGETEIGVVENVAALASRSGAGAAAQPDGEAKGLEKVSANPDRGGVVAPVGGRVAARRVAPDGDGTRAGAPSLTAEGTSAAETPSREAAAVEASAHEARPRESSAGEASAREAASAKREAVAGRESAGAASREVSTSERAPRALRESRRGEAFETSILPAQGAAEAGGVLAREAAEAALRERALRSRGVPMPRRVLLAVSDPARMAQVNLLLRSASYEVRAAFDGAQALDLLRIERADVLLVDLELKRFDGLEVLRRLHERHRGRLPLPVLLLHPRTEEGARTCAAARTLGARGFIPLPYDPAELLKAVREIGGKD